MVAPPRDKEWRLEWQNSAPRAEFSRPTDATFAKAEAALLDPKRSAIDRKFAALEGVPQQVSSELMFPMWIPARELTVSFSDTEIMTSLGSTPQSPVWTKSLEHLRDFKAIRNAGISFTCTDRDVCSKLGGEFVTICGKKFKVQPYSKYSHWYYVDLQRLPDDVTDAIIYDWFVKHGTPPVYITPAHTVGGLRSRSRRVYFNQKLPPASLMIDKETPLRQIRFTAQGFAVVHHRLQAYNRTIPPFIKELRAKRRAPKKGENSAESDQETGPEEPEPGQDTDSNAMSGIEENNSENSDGESSAGGASENSENSGSDSEPHSGDQSDSDSGSDDNMDDVEKSIIVHPDSVWVSGPAPKFPVGSVDTSDFTPARVRRAKKLVFGSIADPAVEYQLLPPSQKEYPLIATVNSYEWLSNGEGGTIPPDQDIILWNKAENPPRSVASYIQLPAVTEALLNASVYGSTVEEMSLEELCSVLEEFSNDFSKAEEPDEVLAKIQAQPSMHRVLLDTKSAENFVHLRQKAFGHAVLRGLCGHQFSEGDDGTVSTRLKLLFPDRTDFDPQTILGLMYPDEKQFWLQTRLAEFDLALQIIAPSIYMDPAKLGSILGGVTSALPHPMWHLWDDATLGCIILSPLTEKILAGPVPADLRLAIEYLHEKAKAAAAPVNPSL